MSVNPVVLKKAFIPLHSDLQNSFEFNGCVCFFLTKRPEMRNEILGFSQFNKIYSNGNALRRISTIS